MRTVPMILFDRQTFKTDCTEDESALLKRTVKQDPTSEIALRIAAQFLVEYSEAVEELERDL